MQRFGRIAFRHKVAKLCQIRRMRGKGFAHGAGAPDEHASIPAIMTALHVARGRVGVGFFNETLRLVEARHGARLQRITRIDVAETGCGIGRLNAHRHDHFVPLGNFDGIGKRQAERLDIAHELVGRQDTHDPLRIVLLHQTASHRDGWCRIAFARLADDVGVWHVPSRRSCAFHQLFGGDDENAVRRNQPVQPLDCERQKRTPTKKGNELLRAGLGAQRPETLATTACQNHCVCVFHRNPLELHHFKTVIILDFLDLQKGACKVFKIRQLSVAPL